MSDHPDYCAGHNDGYEQAVEELKGKGVIAIPRTQYDALMALATSPIVHKMERVNSKVAALFVALRAAGIQTEDKT